MKIKKNKTLLEYKELIQNLRPALTNKLVEDAQDFIEHQAVTYSPEDIKEENFLEFVAEEWPDDIGLDSFSEHQQYQFSLYWEGQEVCFVSFDLELEESTESDQIKAKDIDIVVEEN